MSKIFTKILNERFINWAKENNVDKQEQAGYCRNYSTIDQIFNLQSLVQKYMCKSKGRCYVLMVDFSKAFDTVPHALLWYKLMKLGVHGRVLNVLRSMYKGFKSCVRMPEGLTDYFDCARGTRQGCMLSPMLFVLYISELIDMLSEEGCIGAYINEDAPNIILLLFANDIAMCSDMPGRLQHMLKCLENVL